MQVIREEKNPFELGTNSRYENPANTTNPSNWSNFYNDVIAKNRDNLCKDMREASIKNEQAIDERISKSKKEMLNKTTDMFRKTEQVNDERIKQMVKSFVNKDVVYNDFDIIENKMNDLSMIHQDLQLSFLKNKKESSGI